METQNCKMLPSGRALNSLQQEAFSVWQRSSPYFGKTFSILGDSISTLDGWVPEGYNVFYADQMCYISGVCKPEDTWWGQVISFFGGRLLENNSWSGSRVTALPESDRCFPSGCSDERTGALGKSGESPDVILVALGFNDWGSGAALDATGIGAQERTRSFRPAYTLMLEKLRNNYPCAEIWCLTPCISCMPSDPGFSFPYAFCGVHLKEYVSAIRDAAIRNRCRTAELYRYQLPYSSIDGSHPNDAGMQTLAALVIREMGGGKLLECDRNEHDWSAISDREQVCRRCGHLRHKTKRSEEGIRYLQPEATVTLLPNELKLWEIKAGEPHTLTGPRVSVGRRRGAGLELKSSACARRHAEFFYDAGQQSWFLTSLHAKNGTYLNSVALQHGVRYQLYMDDVITFADEHYRFFPLSELHPSDPVPKPRPTPMQILGARCADALLLQSGRPFDVWRIYDAENDLVCLAKCCAASELPVFLLRREYEMYAALDHPAIPGAYALVESAGGVCLLREYLYGSTLKELIGEDGKLHVKSALDIAIQLCDLDVYLRGREKPILLTDLKPENLVLTLEGTLKVIDLESAICYDDDLIRVSFAFLAPEVMNYKPDQRSPVYSIGMILCWLLGGFGSPEETFHPSPVPETDPALAAILAKSIEPDPNLRWPDSGALREQLRAVLERL